MREYIKEYFERLKGIFDSVVAGSADGATYQLDEAIVLSVQMVTEQVVSGAKLIFIGNGASAAIASHMTADFLKNAGIRAISFNDSSLLTCISNDYGYEYVFEKPIDIFADNGDVLFAISSSGRSENIMRGVRMAKSKGCRVITLSGFDENNPLRSLGELNFYVPLSSYGPVEVVHQAICHCILDGIIHKKSVKEKRTKEKVYR